MDKKRRKKLTGKFGPIRRERNIGDTRAKRSSVYGEKMWIPVRGGKIEVLLYRACKEKQTENSPILFEVHGGGFMYNSAYDDDNLCAYLNQRLGITVVACNYRRTPKYPYPIGLEDVYSIIRYMIHSPKFHIDRKKIIILGHSAGGNLAASTVLLAKQRKEFLPCMQILDYPHLNVYIDSKKRPRIRKSLSPKLIDMFADFYTKTKEERRNPLISPVFAGCDMLEGLPPTYILTCGNDSLNIDGTNYAKLLQKNGVEVKENKVKNAIHGFVENTFNYDYNPWKVKMKITKKQAKMAYEAVEDWITWIEKKLQKNVW